MKLYKVDWLDHDMGWQTAWCSSKRAIPGIKREARRVSRQAIANDDFMVRYMNFPTDKKGLIRFLNIYAAGETG